MEDEIPFAGEDDETEGDETEGDETEGESILDRLRGSGVGTEDPNIIGDAGPTDIPPGSDPPEPA